MKDLKFTKEIKQNWVDALKSGKYIQGVETLINEGKHCCLAVLGEIHSRLTCFDNEDGGFVLLDGEKYDDDYEAFVLLLTHEVTMNLINENDANCDGKYTSVIPLIEQLETLD